MSGLGEVYFEFVAIGRVIKAVAIDPVTGVEVTVIGPIATPQRDLERIAVRKLQRAIARKQSQR